MGADWGPVVVAVVMFILLSPGLLFQLPARTRVIEFGNMYTSGIAILVHAVLYKRYSMEVNTDYSLGQQEKSSDSAPLAPLFYELLLHRQ
ncbi:hypothetical protein RJ640_028145 [Escallonia rubra]|uniref:Uncharacterized protein n=1 Tax=Escallonia rubra TaxID=112253 RepID=A0AA88RYB9_9ASTE|nr:hypothetical protein RJ640_028145 [Escallonia rubra]